MFRTPNTIEENEYELVDKGTVQGHPDDMDEIKKNLMIGKTYAM